VLTRLSSALASWSPEWVKRTGIVVVGSRLENIIRRLAERET
jgi:hypothetical protein